MKSGLRHRRRADTLGAQSGYMLIMILVVLAIMVIALTVAAPKVAQQVKREREEEMMHRGTEYARAVKKFYIKFRRYPTSVEQLENTNNIRFLRKKYNDPTNPEGVWRVVRFGEVQLSQPVNGAIGVGLTPGKSQETPPAMPGEPATPDPNAQPGSAAGGTSSVFGNSGGQALGGGGGAMMGVASLSKGKGIHEFNEKAEYAQWFFIYDPNQDRGNLLRGPYNPKALFGGSSSIPGALNPNQLNQPSQQQQQQQQPPNSGEAPNR